MNNQTQPDALVWVKMKGMTPIWHFRADRISQTEIAAEEDYGFSSCWIADTDMQGIIQVN